MEGSGGREGRRLEQEGEGEEEREKEEEVEQVEHEGGKGEQNHERQGEQRSDIVQVYLLTSIYPRSNRIYRSGIDNCRILWVTSPGDSTALSQGSYI